MGRHLVAAVTALAVASWVAPAFAETPKSDAKPSRDAAWFVIGIQPANARVEVQEPWIKNGVVWSFHVNFKSYVPEDGFILVKGDPGKAYGVAAGAGLRYRPCGSVALFHADAGTVVYITSISFAGAGAPGLEALSYSQDMEGARAFLKAHYPGLSDSLEPGRYQMAQHARVCSK